MSGEGLERRWLEVCGRVGARGDLASAGAALLGRWAEPHRRYHDLRHLATVLDRVDQLAAEAADADLVRLGAWFHDAVYDPTAADNEQRSAKVAAEALEGMDVEPPVVAEVVRLVLLTRTHAAEPGDRDGAVLCDADLAVLARPDQEYAAYAAAVRAEYAHVPDETFATGRAGVLTALLGQDPLFRTAYGREHWQAAARANLRAELARLRTAR